MNEIGCQRAIRERILDTKDILTYDLEQNGVKREIGSVALSTLTAPNEYYHVAIQVRRVNTSKFGGINIENRGRIEYSVSVHVADVALSSAGDEPYEIAHQNMRMLVSGLYSMLTSTYWVGSSYSTYFESLDDCFVDPVHGTKYYVDGDVVIENNDQTWTDPNTNQWTGILYSVINFSMLEVQDGRYLSG